VQIIRGENPRCAAFDQGLQADFQLSQRVFQQSHTQKPWRNYSRLYSNSLGYNHFMHAPPAGFREIAHTADWELEVWAPDLPGLFEQAARGMYSLMGVRLLSAPRQSRALEIDAIDGESLLVRFLEELLYIQGLDGLAFDAFQIGISKWKLLARMEGAPMETLAKEIKAVTYHRLEIQSGKNQFEVSIVFDV
jgi:SHS2 domain-containing protein